MNKYNEKIDYTNLNPDATENDIVDLCKKAIDYGVKSVCVRPNMVKIAKKRLENSKVLVCTVVSFPPEKGIPGGTNSIEEKLKETEFVISEGADEVDMVLNYLKLKNDKFNNTNYLLSEVSEISELCHKNNKILKVIIESGELNMVETVLATKICTFASADFVKTSTGYTKTGAELDKIKLIAESIKNSENTKIQIKASGGINKDNIDQFFNLVQRLGMGFKAVDELNQL